VRHPETDLLVAIQKLRPRAGLEVSELALRGAVRATNLTSLGDHLAAAGDRSPWLLLDLSQLDYLCSEGLGVLLRRAHAQEQQGGWLRIVDPSPTVTMILGLSGVSDIVATVADAEEALRDLVPHAA
jgi:anti-anti-sigma factor